MTVRAPSVATLMSLKDVTRETAKRIRLVIKTESYEDLGSFAERYCPKTTTWFQRCLHSPSKGDVRAHILDELLDTFGVEYLFETSEGLAGYCSLPSDKLVCTYLNAGDTYTATLINTGNGWRVGCWGDVAERYIP